MKNIKYIASTLSLLICLESCHQDTIDLIKPETPVDTSCEDADNGNADFSKFIAIGNSFVAGMQAGALFTEGQNNSLPAIMNKQFECAGAPATFNQPTIGASLGYNLFITQPFLSDNTRPILGKMLLQYGDNIDCETGEPSPLPTPQAYNPGVLEALPNPTFNPGFMYAGENDELNNFGVPAITLGQLLTPATGNWGDPDPTEGFTPFYARFASAPGSSTIISDAASSGGTFFLFWGGLDDFFLYAAFGANNDESTPAATRPPLTPSGVFGAYYNAVFHHPVIGLFTINPDIKGVVGNFPDIFKMPHFTAVAYNPIPLDAATASALTAGFSGYNAALDGLIANKAAFGISDELADEISTRKLTYSAGCNNKILLVDEELTDLGPYFDILRSQNIINDEARAKLAPYEQVRQSTPDDVIPLSTGTVLGTTGVSGGVMGVTEPLGDRWVIIPTEKEEINTARTAYNNTVQTFVNAHASTVALADISAALDNLVTAKAQVINGVTITPKIDPPTGIYSEDGVHPNTRGYAYLSRIFIEAINETFDATVPLTNISNYKATALPIQ